MTEVEVKLTLEESGYRKVIDHFQSSLQETLDQWNIFFDTPDDELGSQRCSFRLRQIKSDKNPERWFICCKKGGQLSQGVAIRPETEAEIDKDAGNKILSNPNLIFKLSPQIIQNELQEVSSSKFEIIGDFRTIRRVISFAGMKIEADESFLPDNSVFFELEIECENPQQAKKEIEAELNKIGVSFVDSTKGKMARLMSLPPEKRISRKSCVID